MRSTLVAMPATLPALHPCAKRSICRRPPCRVPRLNLVNHVSHYTEAMLRRCPCQNSFPGDHGPWTRGEPDTVLSCPLIPGKCSHLSRPRRLRRQCRSLPRHRLPAHCRRPPHRARSRPRPQRPRRSRPCRCRRRRRLTRRLRRSHSPCSGLHAAQHVVERFGWLLGLNGSAGYAEATLCFRAADGVRSGH